jgi:lysozyme
MVIEKASDACLDLIKRFEGYSSKAYLDSVNVRTIGYGTTVYPSGKRVALGDVCTEQQADAWLKHDVQWAERAVYAYTRDDINQGQFDALVSFAYNLGAGALRGSTLLKLVNANPCDYEAITKQFMRWNKAGGKVLKGLTRRRTAEAYMYAFGVDKGE